MASPTVPPPELEAWEQDCLRLLGDRVVVAGVGNRDLGDDGVGPAVAEGLHAKGAVTAFDCGTAPENYLGRIASLAPTDVVFVDAADLAAEPGTVRLLSHDALEVQSPSTHAAGLAQAAAFLAGACSARCHLLAIQPAATTRREGLSASAQAALARILGSPVWERAGQTVQ